MINAIISISIALARILGVKHEAFQAVAHLYVGGLFTASYIYNRSYYRGLEAVESPWLCYAFLAVFLTIVETVVAFSSLVQ